AEQIKAVAQAYFLSVKRAVVFAAIAAAPLAFQAGGFVAGEGSVQRQLALQGIDPEPDFQGGTAHALGHWPTEGGLEMAVGVADQAVFEAREQDHVGAEVEQGREVFLRFFRGQRQVIWCEQWAVSGYGHVITSLQRVKPVCRSVSITAQATVAWAS
nr:hypothetical protein [Tanacetum cinerariifolium]